MRDTSRDRLPDVCLCFPVTLPATIMTSSVPTTVGGHMMYPSPHAVMYAPTSGLADGSLTVLNAFSQAPSTMQVSHSQVQEQGEGRARAEERRTMLPFTALTCAPAPTPRCVLTHASLSQCPHISLHKYIVLALLTFTGQLHLFIWTLACTEPLTLQAPSCVA